MAAPARPKAAQPKAARKGESANPVMAFLTKLTETPVTVSDVAIFSR